MKERPILFSAEMVRAILDGRKTQTRRIVKPQPHADFSPVGVGLYSPTKIDRDGDAYPGREVFGAYDEEGGFVFPYGVAGDRLWVREAFGIGRATNWTYYRADWGDGAIINLNPYTNFFARWKPSIFMPRNRSRITLEITKVRVERLQEISREDAKAEGMVLPATELYPDVNIGDKMRECFRKLWDSINGKGAWDRNPWAWVLEFRKL